MKSVLIVLMIVIIACFSDRALKITGRYIHEYRDEFSMSYDTLIVSRLQNGSNAGYEVQKISRKHRTLGNTVLPAKRNITQWHGVYETKTGSIQLEPD